MAILDNAFAAGKRGLRSAGDVLSRAGANPASVAAPTVPDPVPQGLRSTGSPEAQAYQAERAAQASKIGTPTPTTPSAIGRVTNGLRGASPGLVGPLATGALEALQGFNDSKTLSAAAPDNVTALQDTAALAGERVGRFAGATAGAGLGASAGSAILPGVGTVLGGLAGGAAGYFAPDLVKRATNAIGLTDDVQLPSEKAAGLRAPVGVPAPAPITPASTIADPATLNAPGIAQPAVSNLDRAGPLSDQLQAENKGGGLRSPQALETFNKLQAARNNGITATRGPNGVTLANDPNVKATPVANTGFDLGAANAAQARANAIRASTAPGEQSTLFSNPTGVATATGTPLSAEPRQQVSADGSLGGRIQRRQQDREANRALQRDELGLRRQQLGQSQAQFGAEFGLKSKDLDRQTTRDARTDALGRDQLERQDKRDAALGQYQQGELGLRRQTAEIERQKFGAEYGLKVKADQRADTAENIRIKTEGTDKYNKHVADQLPLGPDGKVDQGAANFHTAAANQAVGDRMQRLERALAKDPKNAAIQKDYTALKEQGLGALDDKDKQQLFAGAEFARLASSTGTGRLNPFGSTDVTTRAPATGIKLVKRLTGDVYVDDQGREVPARLVDGDGSFLGGKRNATFNILKGR